jgi:hypothetical protein
VLLGKAPYQGQDTAQVWHNVRQGTFDRSALVTSEVPRSLVKICLRAMARRPEARPSAARFARDLEGFVRRRRLYAVLVAAAAMVLVALLVWILLPRPLALEEPDMAIRVLRGRGHGDLVNSVPLHTGDQLKLVIKVPPKMYTSLFLVNGEGRLFHLENIPPLDEPREFSKSYELKAPQGTELILVCMGQAGFLEHQEMALLWNEKASWPTLPDQSVLQVDSKEVKVIARSRDLVPIPDTEADVEKRLEDLRQRLRPRSDHILGFAFLHKE